MRKCTLVTLIVLTVLGVLLVVAGIVLIFESKKIIRQDIEKLLCHLLPVDTEPRDPGPDTWASKPPVDFHDYCQIKNVILKNGSEAYKAWKDPPADIYMQFWVFNVENPWEVISRNDKPNVTQRGPYTYRELRSKEDITFEKNGTVISYREPKAYVFEEHLSVGSHDDNFTTVNLPILTVAALLQKKLPGFVLPVIATFLSAENERLFEQHTVKEFLWGYTEKTLEKINKYTEKYLGYHINSTVGLFTGPTTNGSDDGVYTIFSGAGDIDQLNVIDTWKGKPNLKYWKTPACNMINGTDGTKWHPFINETERLYLFSSDICRSIYVDYNGTSSVEGIKTYHFTPPPSVFMDHVHNPDNAGFCVPGCLESGVLDVSSCKGAPIIVSQPHFYQGSPNYIHAIIGMEPDEQYSTLIDIEPYTGTALNVAKKLQLNAKITKLRAFKDTANFNMTIFPMLWLNESAQLSKSDAGKFKDEVVRNMQILEGLQYAMLALGCLILLAVLIFVIVYKVRSARDSEDPPLIDSDDALRGDT